MEWGKGGGGGSSQLDTKRRPSALDPWRRWGGGQCAPNTSFPTCRSRGLGGHSPAAPHLGPAYLGWGRGDAAAGGLGAVSVFVSLARGAQGATTMGWDAKGAVRDSVARVLNL